MTSNFNDEAQSRVRGIPTPQRHETLRVSSKAAPVAEEYELVEIQSLQPPRLTRQSGVYRKVTLEEESEKKEKKENVEVKSLIRLSAKKGGMRYTTTLNYGGSLAANGAVGKYLLQFPSGSTQLKVDQVASAGEWTSFNSVFEEFFCSKMTVRFIPINRYLAYVGATNLGTTGLSIAAYQHDQGAVTDAAASWYQMMNSSISKHVDSADPFTFEWRNVEKFDWKGTANNVTGSQGWMNIADVSNYGGYVSAATAFAAAAGSTASAFNQNQVLGTVLIEFRMHFRYRD